ncbi:hypothetical protein OG866_12300 [Streptomyces sp. NBC_00663]|uniref:hypothetical protein n=1 Tax=Streptomyces sp. NBC_00663 TaxID=2975801 RepID=UPI002E3034C4|nr:hypothetical protein [Streptomyces sp. NBC_00663]
MTLTLSAVLLFGAASAVAIKTRTTGPGSALLLFLFGFFAAGTGAYGPIRDLVSSFADFLASVN